MTVRRRLPVLIASGLLLVACGDLPSASGAGETDRLLSDAELLTPLDPAAASVRGAWDLWIRANHHVIRSLTSRSHDDLQFLRPVIGDRRLVQLGESGHGVREFSQVKVRLIRFLHQEMGFDVIAFESGLFECWKANQLADGAPVTTMRHCIFGVWHTQEVLALFEYIRQTRSTVRPLHVAGFDVQTSSGLGAASAADFLGDVVATVNATYGAQARALEVGFSAEYGRVLRDIGSHFDALADSIAAVDDREQFTARYDALREFLEANEGALVSALPADPQAPLVARQLAFSRLRRIAQLRAGGTLASSEIRDLGMADNLDFLLDRLYPGRKVMVWGHNAHIMHDIRRPLDHSVEALFYRPRRRWVFVDLLSQTPKPGTSWMFGATPAKEWGTTDVRFVPRDQFDGILFVHSVSPPRYF